MLLGYHNGREHLGDIGTDEKVIPRSDLYIECEAVDWFEVP